MSVIELLDRGVDALVRLDVEELKRLASPASEVKWPETAQEQRATLRMYRAFGSLLASTRGTLRLLGRDPGRRGRYSERLF